MYVRPFPDADTGLWQVSTGGGSKPMWAPDGRELFYVSAGNGLMAVSVETEPTFAHSTPEMLFEGNYLVTGVGPNYDMAADGRFLMITQDAPVDGTPAQAQIHVVLNWFEELKRLVPTN